MKEMTEAQKKAKELLYEPEYKCDKDAGVREAAASSPRATRTSSPAARPSGRWPTGPSRP